MRLITLTVVSLVAIALVSGYGMSPYVGGYNVGYGGGGGAGIFGGGAGGFGGGGIISMLISLVFLSFFLNILGDLFDNDDDYRGGSHGGHGSSY